VATLPERHIRSTIRLRYPRVVRLWLLAVSFVAATFISPALVSAAGPSQATDRAGDFPRALPPAAIPRIARPPVPPQKYRLPQHAIWVSNSAQLRRALSRYTSRDIILRNGVYDGSEPFSNSRGDRLYAQTLGRAVFGAGISLGGSSGPGGGLVRGIAFDVQDASKTLGSSIIHVWGTGKNSQILDVTLEGHGAVGAGIKARQVDGLVIQRTIAGHFHSWGLIVDANEAAVPVSRPPVVEDVDAAYVSWSSPRSSNGTAEACVWIGSTAVVRRVRAHDCAWEGLWVGTAASNALFEDIRITDVRIGVYLEHFVNSSTFRRLQIGPNVSRGLTCEWADPAWDSRPACVNNVIEQSSFDTQTVGVYLDAGTTGTTVRTSTFANQCWAAIGNFNGIDNLYDTSGNDYSALGPGAVPISADHYYQSARCLQASPGG
jgi:parallel beta helix pectate lyase-like protein